MGSPSSSFPLDLTLGLKASYVPKSIPNLLKDLSENVVDDEVKLMVMNDYLLKHQEELAFVDAYSKQLIQCKLLLLDAIEILKEEIRKIKAKLDEPMTTWANSQQQWSDFTNERRQTSPTLDAREFLDPLPRGKQDRNEGANMAVDERLLNYKPLPITQSIMKNNRRSWTPELHNRFLEVLDLLGGPEVATPKQIREYMQVEGLTTNQVKSHLQKYRLHCKSHQDGSQAEANNIVEEMEFSGGGHD